MTLDGLAAMRAFISYAREDRSWAERIARDLEANGVSTWIDTRDLLPGLRWRPAISKAIRESTHFLALVSSTSLSKRGFVQKEMRIALEILDEIPEGEIFLIPVRLDHCVPADDRLRDLQWVDLFESYEAALGRIPAALKVYPPLRRVMDSIFDRLMTAYLGRADKVTLETLREELWPKLTVRERNEFSEALSRLREQDLITEIDEGGRRILTVTPLGAYSAFI